jgi:class 3 adenylate cyclase
MDWRLLVRRLVRRLARVGVRPGDEPDLVVRKETLTIAASTITLLAGVWVATYLLLGRPLAAVIPLFYQVVSVAGLVAFARTGAMAPFRSAQLSLMLVLPFVLQWTLGGFANSSAVSLWASVAAFAAVYLHDTRGAVPWFVGFIALVVVSGILDPVLAAAAVPIPEPVRVAFFVLNVGAVSFVAYLLLQHFVREREAARAASERLLLNVLPRPIADRLKLGERVIADAYPDVTVLFADLVGFTPFVAGTTPDRLVQVLDRVFSAFDELAERHGVEKIKTIGDAYMVVGGAPIRRPGHSEAVADLALDMIAEGERCVAEGLDVRLRIGIDRGPVIAGVIGRRKFIYDLWGDTVNTASRMESHGLPGRIHVTPDVEEGLRDTFRFERREPMEVKGKGRMATFFLVGRRT